MLNNKMMAVAMTILETMMKVFPQEHLDFIFCGLLDPGDVVEMVMLDLIKRTYDKTEEKHALRYFYEKYGITEMDQIMRYSRIQSYVMKYRQREYNIRSKENGHEIFEEMNDLLPPDMSDMKVKLEGYKLTEMNFFELTTILEHEFTKAFTELRLIDSKKISNAKFKNIIAQYDSVVCMLNSRWVKTDEDTVFTSLAAFTLEWKYPVNFLFAVARRMEELGISEFPDQKSRLASFCADIHCESMLNYNFSTHYNADVIRKYVISGNSTIPGASTVHFDEISKDKIFKSIDKIKGMKTLIKESYVSLKNRLGRVPLLYDFYENQEIDPLVIIREYKTYYAFMQAMEKDKYKNNLNEQEKLTLEYLSKTVLSGVRPDELAILNQLLYRDHIGTADFIKEYQKTYGIEISTSQVNEAIQVLQGHFVSKEAEYQKFCQIDILENDQSGMIRRLQSYTERLAHIQFYTQVEDIIKVGIARYKDKYSPGRIVDSPFVLYEKYSRRDVSLLMNCGKDLSSIMYGMKRIEDDVFIFITYHKEESQDEKNYVEGKPDYADAFEDDLIFKWDSQIGKGLDSSYMKDVLEAERKHLFVKKSDAEASFYYMGQFDVLEARNAHKEDNRGRMQPITKVTMKMHHAVREDLLRYLQSHITA